MSKKTLHKKGNTLYKYANTFSDYFGDFWLTSYKILWNLLNFYRFVNGLLVLNITKFKI